MVPVQFSAIQSAFISGKYVFISAGDSVSGVSWNIVFTPSIVVSKTSSVTLNVGSRYVTPVCATASPIPTESLPCSPAGITDPY